MTFTGLASLIGVGAAIQTDVPGQFTAKLEVFNVVGSVGFVTIASNVAGDALFVGATDSLPEITKAIFSISSPVTTDFALGTLYLANQAVATPEPGSVFLVGGALAALAFKLLHRS